MLSLLRLESKHKNYSNPLRIRIFLFLSFSFGIEMINTFIHSVVPSKTIPAFRPKRPKTLPDGTAHTHMAYIREHPPPPPPPSGVCFSAQTGIVNKKLRWR